MDSTQSTVLPPAIEFRNVSLWFDNNVVLNDISFSLHDGEMLILTGASGSGKSVLLRLAIGLLRPDAGQILIKGRHIGSLKESELLAIRGGLMGMVFQEESLFTGLTVFDNVAYRLVEHGWSNQDTQKAVTEVLHFVGLDGEEEKLPQELSGGMKRRVEIARALIGWPSIMLFDEPTMSLDPIMAAQVLDLVMRARDINKITSIYVTKKLHEISYLCEYRAVRVDGDQISLREEKHESRIMVLDAGQIVFDGGPVEFLNSKLPSVERLLALNHYDHSNDPYFENPWDPKRHAHERLL
ncbi:MAG TPA: ATP-binding cassette domain-containing protein [Pyrinomonadaceae bacterium]